MENSTLELLLDRKYKKETYTVGDLYVDGEWFCSTMEDKDRGLSQTMPLEEIKSKLRNYVCHSTVTLTEADVEAIKEIEKEYLRPEFIFGK